MKNSKKKVLIITYYWPPAGGSGVQRWLKFVKYLRDFNIEPIIYTVKNPSYPILDKTLTKEIPKDIETLKLSIFEPNTIIPSTGFKNKKNSSGFLDSNPAFLGRLIRYIRANYFIPDARKFWIKPSVNFLSNYLTINHIDVIISSGPPHSMHLIGLELKKKFPVKWISDFRDPWTEIDYFHQLPLTKKATKKHYQLEKEVLEKSDSVIVVGNTIKERFLKYTDKINVITNGFDTYEKRISPELDTKFLMTHVGMMNSDRNPTILWEVLQEICETTIDFKNNLKIRLIGKVDPKVIHSLNGFDSGIIECIDYVHHQDVANYQLSSQVLLLSINQVPSAKGIITGKIFEYLQAKRPILAIGPEDGDAAMILNHSKAGKIFGFKNKSALKVYILELYSQYKQGVLNDNTNNIEKYHRKNLTNKLAEVIKEVLS